MPKDHNNATILIQEIAKHLQELDTKMREGIKTIPMEYRRQYDALLGNVADIIKEELAILRLANKDHKKPKYDTNWRAHIPK